MPFFALMSAGVVLAGGGELLGDPVVLGVVAGLVVGKPIGVLLGGWLVARFTRAELDPSIGWRDVVGVALLAGIGFTVSLLVSDLSFSGRRARRRQDRRAGRLAGLALCSACWLLGPPRPAARDAVNERLLVTRRLDLPVPP